MNKISMQQSQPFQDALSHIGQNLITQFQLIESTIFNCFVLLLFFSVLLPDLDNVNEIWPGVMGPC